MPLTIDIRSNPGAITVAPTGATDTKITVPTGDHLLIDQTQKEYLATELAATGPTVTDTLLANGDSITYGVRPGVTLAQTFVQKVGVARGFPNIVNTAVPGDSTSNMLSHWASDLATHNPSAAFIMMSANNDADGVSIAQAKSDMTDMINMAQDAGARVTIATHNPYVNTEYLHGYALQERDMMQELAGLPGVQFADVFSDWCVALFYEGSVSSSNPYFRSLYAVDGGGNPDWIHPSAIGHQLITDLILKNPLACARG